ncbi:META domain-containing protein [Marinobacter bohaiensis]|uniref:META domain-containing protein n=1 Tax=Marinobacter bohaiensis TaxID=2201898 RepID=UPI000DAE6556|nr:META domain-containing protein [Marinobacter bohaiensis]
MKYPITLTLLATASLLGGCASGGAVDAPDLIPGELAAGRYMAEDENQVWVFWPNGVFERALARSADKPPVIDWGQWWPVPGDQTLVARGDGAAPEMLRIVSGKTLALPVAGTAAPVELEWEDAPAPLQQDRSMALCFMTMADAPLAYDPRTMRNWPVAMEQAYPQLETIYAQSERQPPQRVAVSVDGHWVQWEAPDAGGEQLFLRVSQVNGVMDADSLRCPALDLQGQDWVLRQLDRQPVQTEGDHDPVHITFGEDRRAHGLAGCNRFSGPFERRRDALSLGPLATTRMMCPQRQETEQAFLDALGRTERFAIEGRRLFLMSGNGQVLAVLRASE